MSQWTGSDLEAEDCCVYYMPGTGSDLEAEDCCLCMSDASVENTHDPDYTIHLCEANFAAAPSFAPDFASNYDVLATSPVSIAPHPQGVLHREVPRQGWVSGKNRTGAHSPESFTPPCSRTVHLHPSRSKLQSAKRAKRKSRNHPLDSIAILQVQSTYARILALDTATQ